MYWEKVPDEFIKLFEIYPYLEPPSHIIPKMILASIPLKNTRVGKLFDLPADFQ